MLRHLIALIILLFHAALHLGPDVDRLMISDSSVALAFFAAYQLWVAGGRFLASFFQDDGS